MPEEQKEYEVATAKLTDLSSVTALILSEYEGSYGIRLNAENMFQTLQLYVCGQWPGKMLCAKWRGTFVGVILLSYDLDLLRCIQTAEIRVLAIKDDHCHTGLVELLISSAVKWAKTRRCEQLRLSSPEADRSVNVIASVINTTRAHPFIVYFGGQKPVGSVIVESGQSDSNGNA